MFQYSISFVIYFSFPLNVNTAALNLLIHVFFCTITCFLLDKQKMATSRVGGGMVLSDQIIFSVV